MEYQQPGHGHQTSVNHLKVFAVPLTPLSVHDELINLHQENLIIHEYTLQFRSLADSSGWNQVALLAVYRKGLKPHIRKQIVIYDDNANLEIFIKKTISVS